MTMCIYKITKLFFFALVFTVSFASLSIAGRVEVLTKESFMQACKANQSDEFCACHFEHKKKASHAGNVEMLTNKRHKTEKQAQYKLSYLVGFADVTEANLQQVCEETSGYWETVNVMEDPREITYLEALAKGEAARKIIEAEKIKAEKIFVAYKKSHGMIIMKQGSEHDEVRDSFSTHAGSYCGRRDYLDYLTKAINAPPSAPRFTGRALSRSPCAQ